MVADPPNPTTRRRVLLRWSVCAIYVALITWLSLAPATVFNGLTASFTHADKILHFLMYGLLVWLIRWALSGGGWGWRWSGWWVPLVALGYGALMEGAQSLLVRADRSFEVWDMVANGVGALVFWWLASAWQRGRMNQTSAARTALPPIATADSPRNP